MKITIFFLVATIVAVAGTMISMPQMIGLANAQSEQGSTHACPQGFTLSQGQCTAPQPTTLKCIPSTVFGFQAILGSSQLGANTCTATGEVSSGFDAACMDIPIHLITSGPSGTRLCIFPATEVTGQCPAGTTTSNGQCVTKPGSRDQP